MGSPGTHFPPITSSFFHLRLKNSSIVKRGFRRHVFKSQFADLSANTALPSVFHHPSHLLAVRKPCGGWPGIFKRDLQTFHR
jgi:hypothetical protein